MNAYEIAALDMCLVDYPKDWTYEDICNKIHETQDITVWGPLAHLLAEELRDVIDNQCAYLEKRFDIKPQAVDIKTFAIHQLDTLLKKEGLPGLPADFKIE